MKYLFLALLLVGCGSSGKKDNPEPKQTNWVVVDSAVLGIKSEQGQLSIVSSAATTINYVVAETQTFTANFTSISPVEVGDTVLDLGSITLDTIRLNKLQQCGVSGTDQCTSAAIRLYTTELSGHAGVSGFVNTTYGYGLPVTAGEGTPTQAVGLTSANAAYVDTYTILAGDRKLTSTNFNGVTYDLEVNFSNAGAGSYQMDLVIELVVGN